MTAMSFREDLRRFGPDSLVRVSRDEALAYCAGLTAKHYENFSVVTWLTPRAHRPAFQSIYAFCRWSVAGAIELVARRALGDLPG
jgi:hypothetical protein